MNTHKNNGILDVLKLALQKETEAFNYYAKASHKTRFPETESLWEDWINGDGHADMQDPGQVMTWFNRRIYAECQERMRFVTAFYGTVDPVNSVFMYVSAGHDPPVLVHSRGQYEHLHETQLLLGGDENLQYHNVQIPITKGDILVLFSDGNYRSRKIQR